MGPRTARIATVPSEGLHVVLPAATGVDVLFGLALDGDLVPGERRAGEVPTAAKTTAVGAVAQEIELGLTLHAQRDGSAMTSAGVHGGGFRKPRLYVTGWGWSCWLATG